MSRGTAPRRRLRVMALPAYSRRRQNPFQALLYEAVEAHGVDVSEWTYWRAAFGRCDIWHLHHPDTVVFPRARWQAAGETLAMRLLLGWARARGIRIVWTVHELQSHDGLHPRLERWFWRYFVPRVDAFVSLTGSGLDLARRRFPALRDRPGHVVPHGSFRPVYANTTSRSEARRRLGLDPDAPVILHYGLVRPYKAVPELIAAFRQARRDATLLVAGKVWDPALERKIRDLAGDAPNIGLHLDWIGFEETQLYFNAADVVVLPYSRIMNSGAALLSLSFDRPVLVPAMGAMAEHRARFGSQWVRLFEGSIGPEDLDDAVTWGRTARPAPVDWSGLAWSDIAAAMRAIYDQVLADPTGAAPARATPTRQRRA